MRDCEGLYERLYEKHVTCKTLRHERHVKGFLDDGGDFEFWKRFGI